jgi:hypothetical protein
VPVLTESITAISFVGPQMFAIGGANGLVSLYHANGADEPVVLRSHANPVVAISATKTGHYFSLDTSAEGCTWDAVRIERQRILAQGFEPAGLLAQPTFGPSGSVLVHVGGSSLARSIWVWDVVEQKLRFKRSPQIGRGGLGMLVGKTAVSGNERVAAAVLVRHENADVFGNAAGVLPGLAMRFGGPGPLPRALLDVGAQLLRSDTDAVRLIDLHGNLQYANVKLPEAAHQLFLSSDGQHVLTAGAGWRVHETANGTQVCGLDKREAMLSIAALHPDGQQYAVAVSRNGRTTAQGRGTPQIESPRAAIVLRSFAANDETTLALTAEEETCSIMQMQFSSTGLYLWAAAFNNGANRSQAVGLNLRLLVWKRDDAGHYQRIGVPNDGRLAAHLREAIVVAINEGDGTIACGIRTGPQSAEARVGKFDASRFESIFRFQSGDIEFAGITADGKRLLVVSGTGGGSDSHGAELRVFDLIGKQELLEISLGRVIGAPGGGPSGYHFDGGSLRVAAWNDRGAEMRIIDGAPTR